MKRLMFVFSLMCAAPSAWALDLLEAYTQARGHDSQFAAAAAQQSALREKLPQARARLLPNLTLSASTQYNDASITLPMQRDLHYNSNNYQVTLTQPIFRWQNWLGYQQSELQLGVADAQYTAAQFDLMVRLAQAYFDVLYAQDVLTSVQTLKAAAEQQQMQAKKSFERGATNITDSLEAQSRFDLASAQEIAAKSQLELKRYALSQITGQMPAELAPLRADTKIALPEPADMNQWINQALQLNPQVQIQQLNAQIAQSEISRQRAAYLPSVDLVARYGRTHAGNDSQLGRPYQTTNGVIGVQLSMPIFEGGLTQSSVREAAHLASKAQADLNTAQRNATQSAQEAYLTVANGIAQTQGYEAALRSSQSSLKANQQGYQLGARVSIDVLNAQSQVADTQQKWAKSRYETIIAQLKLKSAAGLLSAEDLVQVNQLLER